MKLEKPAILLFLLVFLVSSTANAYWIRPVFGGLGMGLFQDGLDINGATDDEQFFSDAAREAYARVVLPLGEVGVSVRMGTPSLPLSGSQGLFSNALFGETVVFNSLAPDFWDFSLDVDGLVGSTVADDPASPTVGFTQLKASIAIWEGFTRGTDPEHWASSESLSEALFYDEFELSFEAGVDDGDFFDSIGGSLPVAPGEAYDIVVRMSVGCLIDEAIPAYCDLDFSSTGAFDMGVDPDSYASTSGDFLGSSLVAVPVPFVAWLFPSGLLAGLAWMKKQRR